jgi:uncharacterized protein YbjT (DUF2867 family)
VRIAIATPTGNIGRRLVGRLLDEGSHELVLMARDPDKLKEEQSRGVIITRTDLMDRESVQTATDNADALFWVNPPRFDTDDYIKYYEDLAHNAAYAIKANDINRVVLVSSVGAHLPEGGGPIDGLHKTEAILSEASSNLTILRPAFFMENYLFSMPTIEKNNAIYLPISGDTTVPMVATNDIADAALKVLTDSHTRTRVMSLHGPRDYSFDEAAGIISKVVGKQVKHVTVTPEQAHQALTQMGASENVASLYVELYVALDKGTLIDEVPRSPGTTTRTTLEDFFTNVFAPTADQA